MKANEKPTVKYDPFGESGNIYWIIVAAQRALQTKGKSEDILSQVEKYARSYNHALQIISKYVDLVDISKWKGERR